MIETKIITTKEKKMLDKIFGVLGIDTNQLLKINNLGEILCELGDLKKENEELKAKLLAQAQINDLLTEKINELVIALEKINQRMQEDAMSKIFGGGEVNE